jgi:hypothetical protein
MGPPVVGDWYPTIARGLPHFRFHAQRAEVAAPMRVSRFANCGRISPEEFFEPNPLITDVGQSLPSCQDGDILEFEAQDTPPTIALTTLMVDTSCPVR